MTQLVQDIIDELSCLVQGWWASRKIKAGPMKPDPLDEFPTWPEPPDQIGDPNTFDEDNLDDILNVNPKPEDKDYLDPHYSPVMSACVVGPNNWHATTANWQTQGGSACKIPTQIFKKSYKLKGGRSETLDDILGVDKND